MDDFSGLLTRDFGFKPQGKPAPPRNSPASGDFGSRFGLRSDFDRSSSSSRSRTNPSPVSDYHGGGSAAADGLLFTDVFGGPPKYTSSESRDAAFDYDNAFKDEKISKSSSMPVYDKPVFDEDVFEGLPGIRSASTVSSTQYEELLASISGSPRKPKNQGSSAFDGLYTSEPKNMSGARNEKKDYSNFDYLIPGFGRSNSPASNRPIPELKNSQKPNHANTKVSSTSIEDPFGTLESTSNPAVSPSGIFMDPFQDIYKQSGTKSRKADQASVQGGVFDDVDPLDSLGKSRPGFNRRGISTTPMRTENMNGTQSPAKNSVSQQQKRDPGDILGSHQFSMDLPSMSVGRSGSPNEANLTTNTTSSPGGKFNSLDEVWLTVSEVPLFTQPTRAPPPSRPPPPRPIRPKRSGSRNARKTNNDFSPFENSAHSYSPTSVHPPGRSSAASQLDELDDFASGKARGNAANANGYTEDFSVEELVNPAAAAAAMKEAMEKAEAKFRHAREMREREYLKSSRSKETVQFEKDDYLEKESREAQERLDREKLQRIRDEEEKEKTRIASEREEREREQSRIERERIERERELARQAVQRATREARERAAAEARAKAQKAAVEKAAAEARERAEKAAVQRAQSEARERAAAVAKERANAAAARDKEAREKETRASTERAAVQRAAAEARERAASQARANQRKDENDLESIFNRSSQSSSSPRPRANVTDPQFDKQSPRGPPDSGRTSAGPSSNMHKASSTTNFVDDLSSIFGAASPFGEFREIDGETEERKRARLDREQRTKERAAKALAEKNERDLQAQREQMERHRISETLDIEIKRWAAGKEGNLRAQLSTLQYVLWPECGWQPVSLTDLITATMVKKVYRKATLCIHPDKVQQKGANLQQKYIAEKVFDLLKEAWNKFNSEELF